MLRNVSLSKTTKSNQESIRMLHTFKSDVSNALYSTKGAKYLPCSTKYAMRNYWEIR